MCFLGVFFGVGLSKTVVAFVQMALLHTTNRHITLFP